VPQAVVLNAAPYPLVTATSPGPLADVGEFPVSTAQFVTLLQSPLTTTQ